MFSISIKMEEFCKAISYNEIEKVKRYVFRVKSFNCPKKKLNGRETMDEIVKRLRLLRECSGEEIVFQDQRNTVDVVLATCRCVAEELREEGHQLNSEITW